MRRVARIMNGGADDRPPPPWLSAVTRVARGSGIETWKVQGCYPDVRNDFFSL